MPPNRQSALLEEYRSCSEQITRLDNLIWQTASIIFPITLAGFAFFGSSSKHTAEQFSVIVATAFGSIALLTTWYLLSIRWTVYERVAFYRMREIETELGLLHHHYSSFARMSSNKRRLALKQMKNDEKIRFEKMGNDVGNVPLIGLRRTTTIITFVFIIGWIVLMFREYILTF